MAKSWERGDSEDVEREESASEAPMEVEAPRRAASARFEVQAEVGGEASLREAMDPANQSLADALKLSYRILQGVILVLVVLFLGSGIQTVHEGQTGIRTLWGKADAEALKPGLQLSLWPYPIREFVIIDSDNLRADDGLLFWPDTKGGSTAQALAAATAVDRLLPGRDGSVLTSGGEPGHVKLEVSYSIGDPVAYLRQVDTSIAGKVVQAALRRAVVHNAARWTLDELLDQRMTKNEEGGEGDQSPSLNLEDRMRGIQTSAQKLLDEMHSGIELTGVKSIEDPMYPFSVYSVSDELGDAVGDQESVLQQARDAADKHMISVAGPYYQDLLDLISAYEVQYEQAGEAGAQEELAKINAFLDSEKVGGEVSRSIERAKTYNATIDQTLGGEAKRFTLLYPAYKRSPELFIRERWDSVLASIYAASDIEVFNVPPGIGNFAMSIAGQQFIQDLRRKMQLDEKDAEARRRMAEEMGTYFETGSDLAPGPGRTLRIDEGGNVVNKQGSQ